MSYVPITPAFYEMFQPDTPYHAGSTGWTKAPWPSWGVNPVERGPRMLATSGVGDCGCKAQGDVNTVASGIGALGTVVLLVGVVGLYLYLDNQ